MTHLSQDQWRFSRRAEPRGIAIRQSALRIVFARLITAVGASLVIGAVPEERHPANFSAERPNELDISAARTSHMAVVEGYW